MNLSEATKLLALCSAYDNRHVDEVAAAAWLDQVGGYPLSDCMAAVKAYYADNRDRIMPSDVRTRVKKIRNDRIAGTPTSDPPAGLSEPEYRAWLLAERKRIADGWAPPELDRGRPIELPDVFPSPPEVSE